MKRIEEMLIRQGYRKEGKWMIAGNFRIKFSKRNVILKSTSGTMRVYLKEPLTAELLNEIIYRSII